jgi:hypothetical protein
MAESGVPVEEIARLAGHDRTTTTEVTDRRQLRPVIATGAEIVDRVLGAAPRPLMRCGAKHLPCQGRSVGGWLLLVNARHAMQLHLSSPSTAVRGWTRRVDG